MTVSVFMEDIVQAVLDTLSTYLPAALAAVENKFSAADSAALRLVPLLPPVSYLFGEHAGPGIGTPVLYAYAPQLRVDTMGQEALGSGWALYNATVLVDVFLESDDEEIVERQYARYAEAIYEALYGHQELGGIAIGLTPRLVQRKLQTGSGARVLSWEITVRIEPEF